MTARSDECVAFLRDYAATRLDSRLADARRSLPPYVVLDLGRHGLLGLRVPPSLGGLGFGWVETGDVMVQLGAIDLSLALFVGIHTQLGVGPILASGSQAAREELLPDLARGRMLGGLAITERGAGANPRALQGTARLGSDGKWHLDARKIWSGNGSWAGILNVFVKVEREGKPSAVVGFTVRTTEPGLTFGPEAMTLGMRSIVQSPVNLVDVAVDGRYRLGPEDDNFGVAEYSFAMARLGLAMMASGTMRRCAQLMLRYARRRKLGSGLMAENPMFRAALTELLHQTTVVDRLWRLIAERQDAGLPVPRELFFICKILAPELMWKAADTLVQWLGGRGYVEANEAPQILRDARLFRIMEGPTEALRPHLGALVRGSRALFEFLASDPRGQHVGQRLKAACDQLAQAPVPAGAPLGAPVVTRNAVIGEVVSQAFAWWLLETGAPSTPAARVWAEHGFVDAVQAGLRVLGSTSVHDLEALAQTLRSEIGDLRQTAIGEDWEIASELEP